MTYRGSQLVGVVAAVLDMYTRSQSACITTVIQHNDLVKATAVSLCTDLHGLMQTEAELPAVLFPQVAASSSLAYSHVRASVALNRKQQSLNLQR